MDGSRHPVRNDVPQVDQVDVGDLFRIARMLGGEQEVEAHRAHGLQRRPIGVGRFAFVVRPLRVIVQVAVDPAVVEARQRRFAEVHRKAIGDHVGGRNVLVDLAQPEAVEGRVVDDGRGRAAAVAGAGDADLDGQVDVGSRSLRVRRVEKRAVPLRRGSDVQIGGAARLAGPPPAQPVVRSGGRADGPLVAALDLREPVDLEVVGRHRGAFLADGHLAEHAEGDGRPLGRLQARVVDADDDRDPRIDGSRREVGLEPPRRIDGGFDAALDAGDLLRHGARRLRHPVRRVGGEQGRPAQDSETT